MSDILIPACGRQVVARVQAVQRPRGTVLFVHGSGVDRHDPRNQFIAHRLRRAGFGTVLFDLLEPHEALERHDAFDVELQAERLGEARGWLGSRGLLHEPLGYFATGGGAGVVLRAAAEGAAHAAAVVVRAGRPDKALFWLAKVRAPTLFIVEAPDEWSRRALERLNVDKELAVVPSASHFFREPAALEAVAQHSLRWFSRNLVTAGSARAAA